MSSINKKGGKEKDEFKENEKNIGREKERNKRKGKSKKKQKGIKDEKHMEKQKEMEKDEIKKKEREKEKRKRKKIANIRQRGKQKEKENKKGEAKEIENGRGREKESGEKKEKEIEIEKKKEKRRLLQDEDFMRLALREARKASRREEVPVGAVLVVSGRVVARAHNQPVKSLDPTAHAEILAMRRAARRLKNYRLPEAELYVTLEPCAMCLGAAVQARLKRIVYGAPDPKAGAVSSIMSFPWEKLNHRPEIQGGLLASEAASLLKEFFSSRRQKRTAIDFN